MPVNGFYVGIDGGGTHTTAIVGDYAKNFLYTCEGASINYCAVGLEAARKNMAEIIAQITAETGVSEFESVFIGCSALDGRASPDEMSAFADGLINAKHIGMDSDLFIALEAMQTDKPCAVAICGTGSMAVMRQNGKLTVAGGWGHILGDEGSGYSIGLNGLKAAIGTNRTELTDRVLSHFGLSNIRELIDVVYADNAEKKSIAAFAPEVFACAESGDKIACDIIANEASGFAETVDSLISALPQGSPVGLWGGMFEHRPDYIELFKKGLAHPEKYKIQLLENPPHVGALWAAYKLTEGDLE